MLLYTCVTATVTRASRTLAGILLDTVSRHSLKCDVCVEYIFFLAMLVNPCRQGDQFFADSFEICLWLDPPSRCMYV